MQYHVAYLCLIFLQTELSRDIKFLIHTEGAVSTSVDRRVQLLTVQVHIKA